MIFLARVVFTMLFWVVVARWSYSELAQVSPMMKDSIDQLMEVATIPTHDQWDFTEMKELAVEMVENFRSKEAFAKE